jgi:hypothetical protein
MKKNAILAEIAALAGKKLPVRLPLDEETDAWRVEPTRTTRSLGRDAEISWSSAAEFPASDSSSAGSTERSVLLVVERVFHLLWIELGVMRQMRPDALAVVLEADSQTEIVLHLTRRDGQIEARARCERGDFQSLNDGWGELQRALNHQGVRLMPLAAATTHSDAASSAGSPGRPGSRAQQGSGPATGFSNTSASAKPARRKVRKVRPAPESVRESWA